MRLRRQSGGGFKGLRRGRLRIRLVRVLGGNGGSLKLDLGRVKTVGSDIICLNCLVAILFLLVGTCYTHSDVVSLSLRQG
jgi:hypothetical protein